MPATAPITSDAKLRDQLSTNLLLATASLSRAIGWKIRPRRVRRHATRTRRNTREQQATMKTSLSKTTATDTPKKLLGAGEADAYPFQRQQLPAFMRHEDSVVIGHPMPVIAPAAQYSSAHEVHSRREEVDHDSPSGYQAPQDATLLHGAHIPAPVFPTSMGPGAIEEHVGMEDIAYAPDRFFRFSSNDWVVGVNGVEAIGVHGEASSSASSSDSPKPSVEVKSDQELADAKEAGDFDLHHSFQPSQNSRMGPGGMVATNDEISEDNDVDDRSPDSLYYQAQNQAIFQYYQERQMQMYNYHQQYLPAGSLNLGEMVQQPAATPSRQRWASGTSRGVRSSLKPHRKSHKSPIDTSGRKYMCNLCNKRFTRPSTLKTHMNSHTGERPYACDGPGCGWRFTVLSNLKRHAKICPHVLSACEGAMHPDMGAVDHQQQHPHPHQQPQQLATPHEHVTPQ
ncbi:MAG: hypothetical protein SGCHY_005089 [Lobulomycetales sp.]